MLRSPDTTVPAVTRVSEQSTSRQEYHADVEDVPPPTCQYEAMITRAEWGGPIDFTANLWWSVFDSKIAFTEYSLGLMSTTMPVCAENRSKKKRSASAAGPDRSGSGSNEDQHDEMMFWMRRLDARMAETNPKSWRMPFLFLRRSEAPG